MVGILSLSRRQRMMPSICPNDMRHKFDRVPQVQRTYADQIGVAHVGFARFNSQVLPSGQELA